MVKECCWHFLINTALSSNSGTWLPTAVCLPKIENFLLLHNPSFVGLSFDSYLDQQSFQVAIKGQPDKAWTHQAKFIDRYWYYMLVH